MPAGCQRTGLVLAVADHACHHQVRIVESRAVGVHQGIAELTALVDRPGVSDATWLGTPPGNEN